jgi:hypothetical protein
MIPDGFKIEWRKRCAIKGSSAGSASQGRGPMVPAISRNAGKPSERAGWNHFREK